MKLIFRYLRSRRMISAAFVVLAVVSAVCEAAALISLVPLATVVAANKDRYTGHIAGFSGSISVGSLLFVAAALVVSRAVSDVAASYLRARLVSRYEAWQKTRLFDAFLQASWDEQSAERGGELQDVLSTFVSWARQALDSLCMSVDAAVSLAILMGAALLVNPVAAAAIVSAGVVLFLLVRPLALAARRISTDQVKISQAIGHAVNETLMLSREVRIFRAAPRVQARFASLVQRFERNQRRSMLLLASGQSVYQNAVLLLVIGGLAFVHAVGFTDLASLAAIVLLLIRAMSYSQTFQALYHRQVEVAPYAETLEHRVHSFTPDQRESGEASIDRVDLIEFNNVSFSYTPDTTALKDVSFSVRRGEFIGIVGPSGAGKSTLVQLLLRLRLPDAGSILMNGAPASDLSRESWLERVGYVPQDPLLLNGTVEENIAFFRDFDVEAIIWAARRAHVHDEIMRFPKGYDSLVGERGTAVSGGQRQRICIARALLGRPDVLIFDEPTSSLDHRSETLLHETINELRRDAAVLVVAHRLSTLASCDRVMVFEAGQLQAFGTPSELLNTSLYFGDAFKVAHT